MAFLTDAQIEEKKANGDRMNRLNCGWNLTNEVLAEIISMLNEWEPQTAVEKRDKKICYLAFVKNMNATQIARLNDPLFIGMGNRSKNKPLSVTSILKICYKYAPEAKNRYTKRQKTTDARLELAKMRRQGKITKPKICSTCSNTDNLELHHIIPLAVGGTNDYYNMIYLCHSCHALLHSSIYNKLDFPKKR